MLYESLDRAILTRYHSATRDLSERLDNPHAKCTRNITDAHVIIRNAHNDDHVALILSIRPRRELDLLAKS